MRIILLITLFWISNVSADVKNQTSARHFKEVEATFSLLKKIQRGGYVLYMRHAPTDTSKPDQLPLNLKDCTKQRPLSDLGRNLAAGIGKSIRKAKIPVGKVYASPLCRAKGTAEATFGKGKYTLDNLLMYTSHLTKAQKIPVINHTRDLVSKKVTGNKNRVLVAHAPNMYDLMGYFPKIEGTIVVFKPTGDSYEYIGSIKPHDWLWLLN